MTRSTLLAGLVFCAGAAGMAVEMCASRLLAPYFGDSQLVWAILIGLILIYLTAGAALGGRWADRSPHASTLAEIVTWAGLLTGLVPALSRPILGLAAAGFSDLRAGWVAGAFLGVLALLAPPVLLLGMVPPFAVRVAIPGLDRAGQTAGRVSALSAGGSIVGTLLPVFVLIPWLGTRRSLLAIGLLLVLLGGAASLAWERRRTWLPACMLIALACVWLLDGGGRIRSSEDLIYERESSYNYIRVVEVRGERHLLLNEGLGIQSIYRPGSVLTGHLYDYFLLAPYFSARPEPKPEPSLALIGLAGGTIAHQYTAVFGPVPIDAAEIDPAIIDVAREHFDLHEPNVRTFAQDGRRFLAGAEARYDVIAVDAYRPPYIPFHLTTREFFQLARQRLNEDGVLAVNVGYAGDDRTLVEAIADTVHTVFPSVYIIESAEDYNSLVLASVQPTDLEAVRTRLEGLDDPHLAPVVARALPGLMGWERSRAVLTDDRAPIEQIVHGIVLRYALDAARDERGEAVP
ncbi:MAG: fused MFS/spermidine synthase [Anaerolineae bacterium]|nr:fused MFS/spermidine synthase [Anaerolineae bacterium]